MSDFLDRLVARTFGDPPEILPRRTAEYGTAPSLESEPPPLTAGPGRVGALAATPPAAAPQRSDRNAPSRPAPSGAAPASPRAAPPHDADSPPATPERPAKAAPPARSGAPGRPALPEKAEARSSPTSSPNVPPTADAPQRPEPRRDVPTTLPAPAGPAPPPARSAASADLWGSPSEADVEGDVRPKAAGRRRGRGAAARDAPPATSEPGIAPSPTPYAGAEALHLPAPFDARDDRAPTEHRRPNHTARSRRRAPEASPMPPAEGDDAPPAAAAHLSGARAPAAAAVVEATSAVRPAPEPSRHGARREATAPEAPQSDGRPQPAAAGDASSLPHPPQSAALAAAAAATLVSGQAAAPDPSALPARRFANRGRQTPVVETATAHLPGPAEPAPRHARTPSPRDAGPRPGETAAADTAKRPAPATSSQERDHRAASPPGTRSTPLHSATNADRRRPGTLGPDGGQPRESGGEARHPKISDAAARGRPSAAAGSAPRSTARTTVAPAPAEAEARAAAARVATAAAPTDTRPASAGGHLPRSDADRRPREGDGPDPISRRPAGPTRKPAAAGPNARLSDPPAPGGAEPITAASPRPRTADAAPRSLEPAEIHGPSSGRGATARPREISGRDSTSPRADALRANARADARPSSSPDQAPARARAAPHPAATPPERRGRPLPASAATTPERVPPPAPAPSSRTAARQARRTAAPVGPVLEIIIDRIEVASEAPAAKPAAGERLPGLSLTAYLRRGGRR